MKTKNRPLAENEVFALDIGTRSIIGMVGAVESDKVKILAIEQEEHTRRAMVDGQIEDIDQVARLAFVVKERLEDKLKVDLTRVNVAAAGRALRTQRATYELELTRPQKLTQEIISRLEAGAISEAEAAFNDIENPDMQRRFFLVGYSVLQYFLDDYLISSLKDHRGQKLKVEVVATFLPSEVVESLCTAMNKIGLEISSLTLEPIAAINAAIPQDLRLLNLALADIGAGTSDIAACRDGGIIGYTMATVAGDEITETLMKQYLIDFPTAERVKFEIAAKEEVVVLDVLGVEQTLRREDVFDCIRESSEALCREIAKQILAVNGGVPSAVFLAGGGSKLSGIREGIAEALGIDIKRVAIAGNNFKINACSNDYNLNNPEYATPLGIAISAGLNLIHDSFRVTLNGRPAKLFRSGGLTVLDILMMNGYGYRDLLGQSGASFTVRLNGKRKIIYGAQGTPATLRVNGEDAKISDPVRAGDIIEFLPAIHGEPAQAVLSDVVPPEAGGAALNGKPAGPDAPLKPGDLIVTEGYAGDAEDPDYEDAAGEGETENWEILREAGAAVEEIAVTGSAAAKTEEEEIAGAEDAPPRSETAQSGGAARTAQAAAVEPAAPPAAAVRGLRILLNDRPLLLPQKPDSSPYYLMDVLEHSGLDFDHISGHVELKINGVGGTFLQELRNDDSVVIRCE